MIESVEIKNFRGYKHARLDECRRINIVVGENGSGKTSLLEAIFLASGGSVEVALRFRSLRGYDGAMTGDARAIEQAIWEELFYQLNVNNPITIALNGTEWRNRILNVRMKEFSIPLSFDKKAENLVQPSPITFDWIGPKGIKALVKPSLKDGKFTLPSVISLPEESYFFSSTNHGSSHEIAARFSELSKESRIDEFISRFKQQFPIVEDMSLEMIAGAPMVCAKAKGFPKRVPLNLISSGLQKLAGIVLAITCRRGGVILVDEIENGLYYKRFPDMWKSLLSFCNAYDAQLFVSTHSEECLKAAANVASESPKSFRVIQSEGEGKLNTFGGDSFARVVKSDIEIR